ncbi:MAG: formylglycine-generating enzyme family protein [Armatimonadota bacterium]
MIHRGTTRGWRWVGMGCSVLLAVCGLLCGLSWLADAQDPPAPPAPKPITRTNPKDGATMVWVPAGAFLMGTTNADITDMQKRRPSWKTAWFDDEKPQHTVVLDGYWIYKYEVTVGQYRKYCKATGEKMPELSAWSKDDHPMVNVTWDDAVAYVEWAGARLPTEAEWEKAARGKDGRRYTWGSTWDEEKCNNYSDHNPAGNGYQANRTAPVGSYPGSTSSYGVEDLLGNAWEWCQDWYAPDYYGKSPIKNPTGPEDGEFRVLRGGSWGSSSVSLRCAGRHKDSPDVTYHDDGGFRGAMSGPAPKDAGGE